MLPNVLTRNNLGQLMRFGYLSHMPSHSFNSAPLEIFPVFFFCSLLIFFKIIFFEKFFHDVKQFGARSGPTFCGSKLFAEVIRSYQQTKS